MFESYEQDFTTGVANLKTDFLTYERAKEDMEKKNMLDTMKRTLTECETKIKSMENEAAFTGGGNQLMNKIRRHRIEYDELKKKLMQTDNIFIEKMQKKDLFSARTSSDMSGVNDPRSRVVQSNEKVYNQNFTLTDTTKTANEVDQRTNMTLEELYRQRGMIENGIVLNKDIGKELNRTNYLEDSMSRRECWNRTLLWLTILILLGADVFLLVRKLINTH